MARRFGRAAAYQEEAQESAAFWLRLTGLLLVLALLVLLAAYTLGQVTSRDAAERIIGRAIPGITDFDHAFASHYDELQTAAAASPTGVGGLSLPSYPVKVQLSPNEVINKAPAEVRLALLKHTADAVYDRGINAFSPDGRPVKLGSAGVFSGPWAFKQALGVLNPHVHRQLTDIAKGALAMALVLALLVAVLGREYNRIVIYGMALLFASVPGLLAGVLVWLGVQIIFGTSSDPLIGGTSDITRDVAWFVVLSYLVFVGLSAALTILGLLTERVADYVAVSKDPARSQQYQS